MRCGPRKAQASDMPAADCFAHRTFSRKNWTPCKNPAESAPGSSDVKLVDFTSVKQIHAGHVIDLS